MKKKVYLATICIITVACIIIGCIWHMGGLFSGDFSFSSMFSGEKSVNENKTIDLDDFSSMVVDTDIMDVTVKTGTKYSLHYECSRESHIPKYTVENGTLKVTQKHKGGFHLFSFGTGGSAKLEITVPEGVSIKNLDVKSDTGEVLITGISTDTTKVSLDTGSLKTEKCHLGETNIETDTGDVVLTGSDFGGIKVENDTGDIKISGCPSVRDFDKVEMETDTGDVTIYGENQGEKFSMTNDSGNGHKIKFGTDTGDIIVEE